MNDALPDPAGSAQRLASWLCDLAVVVLVAVLVTQISGLLGGIVLVAGLPAYYVALEGHFGVPTLGHRLLGLRVIDERDGSDPDALLFGIRAAVGMLSLIPFAVPAVLSAAGVVRGDSAWHDSASQTRVVRR